MTRMQIRSVVKIISGLLIAGCLVVMVDTPVAMILIVLAESLLAAAFLFLVIRERIQLAELSSLISKMLVATNSGFDVDVDALRLARVPDKHQMVSRSVCALMDVIERRHAKMLKITDDLRLEVDTISRAAPTVTAIANECEISANIGSLINDSRKNGLTFILMVVRVTVSDGDKSDIRLRDDGLISGLILSGIEKASNGGFAVSAGRDEFIVLVRESGVMEARRIASQIIHGVTSPDIFPCKKMHCKVAIGIAVYPGHGISADSMIKHAEHALRMAEKLGVNRFQFYTEGNTNKTSSAFSIKNELATAFEKKQFYLEFQPQITLSTGLVCGAEALVRWRHPVMGCISPADFIPEAEDSGLILQLGQWVMENACETAAGWCKSGHFISIGVNVSVLQLTHPSFVDMVSTILHKTGLPNFMLDIEITESIMMIDQKKTVEIMNKIRSIGVGLSIDDFGTGFSSLNYITTMPASQIKIDRSFVSDASRKSSAVLEAIVHIGARAGIDVIAEGIETQDQSDRIKLVGCDKVQGYLYAKPMSSEKMMDFLRDR